MVCRSNQLESTNTNQPKNETNNQPTPLLGGKKHTLILSYDGELYACGCNAEGQLGSVDGELYDVPVKVARLLIICIVVLYVFVLVFEYSL